MYQAVRFLPRYDNSMQYCLSLSAGMASPLLVAKNPLEYFASYAFLSFNTCLLLLRKSLAFIWNRYDLSQLMPFSEETSYSYTDCFTKVNVVQSGNTLCLYEEGYVQPYILSFLFLCVVLMLNILGDKSTPEE